MTVTLLGFLPGEGRHLEQSVPQDLGVLQARVEPLCTPTPVSFTPGLFLQGRRPEIQKEEWTPGNWRPLRVPPWRMDYNRCFPK